jgi:tetratricopeptide (TPR) repeat protein
MTGTTHLRTVITGLLGFAAMEEQVLLTTALRESTAEAGNERRWAGVPTVAHNTEFKAQQAERLAAVLGGREPPSFGDIDHGSAQVYAAYAARPADSVVAESRLVTASLLDGVRALADEDLLDPARHAWLRGRALWLQVIVRGFWHPTGHIGEYYLARGQLERAVALHEQALAIARYLGAPDQAAGMAAYSLACALTMAGRTAEAGRTLATAIALNPDVRANAERDPDLIALRDSGQLTAILAANGG